MCGVPNYKTPEELQKAIEKYFKKCPDFKIMLTKTGEKIEIPTPTITGLAYALGFESRQSFYDYEKRKLFSYTIKRARLFIEKNYESMLHTQGYPGAIFALKNFGWTDKTEQTITGALSLNKVFITQKEAKETNKHIDDFINE